jgi:dTMP kinase
MIDWSLSKKSAAKRQSVKGKFITLEGGDGSGKTTLLEALKVALAKQGKTVVTTREPGGTPVGAAIRELLLHSKEPLSSSCELFLFLADRAEHVEKLIRPALERGICVLCDRFNDSTLAYQAGARGLDREEVRKLCLSACGNLTPDLTLYLDLEPKEAFARIGQMGKRQDLIEAEGIAFQRKIQAAFHQIAKEEPTRFIILDASQSKEEVAAQALKKIEALWP